jgi:hypothetical protein
VPVDDRVSGAVERLYRPRRTVIERQTTREMGDLAFSNGTFMSISGICYMLDSMQRVNDLREGYSAETGAAYDVVVATRPDILFHRPLELERYLSYCRPPRLPHDETAFTRFTAFGPMPVILNDLRGLPATDVLFFGVPDVMTRVLTLGTDVHRYDMHEVVAPDRPQNVLNTYCRDIGINVAVIDYFRPRDFEILRAA